tara:strand:+ start:81 stop:392 length:312 start_codon:yes stop_codon:yes gene_type:complete
MIKRLWHELLYQITKLISVKNDLEYTQKITQVEVNKAKIMSKPIEVKENKMQLSTIALFNHMTEEDFIAIHNAGQLKNLCMALSLDLQPIDDEKFKEDNTYSA